MYHVIRPLISQGKSDVPIRSKGNRARVRRVLLASRPRAIIQQERGADEEEIRGETQSESERQNLADRVHPKAGCIMISLTNAAFIAPVSSLAAQCVPPKETRVLYCAQVHECTCSNSMVSRYQKRISGPLLDRIDIHIEVPRVEYDKLSDERLGEPSAAIQARVKAARERRRLRFQGSGLMSNADMVPAEVRTFCQVDDAGRTLLRAAMQRLPMGDCASHSSSELGGRTPTTQERTDRNDARPRRCGIHCRGRFDAATSKRGVLEWA